MTTLLVALVAAGLWLIWNVEHEHTGIRAPWTGLTLVSSAVAFVVLGVVGRGWRALLAAATATIAASLLVAFVVWGGTSAAAPAESSCDPGCIPLGVGLVMESLLAVLLAAAGIALRRLVLHVGRWRRHRVL